MTPRTPFHISQPVDQVIYIMRKTGRQRLALQIEAKEGTFFIDTRRRRNKKIEEELEKAFGNHTINLSQNFTIWYYLSDCTLKFKRYSGIDGKGATCYRIILIDDPIDPKVLYEKPPISNVLVQQAESS